MSPTETEEILTPEELRAQAAKKADQAFVKSQGHTFLGQKLNPFCIDRQIAATAMGLVYGNVRKEDLIPMEIVYTEKGKKKTVTLTTYRQALRDIIIVLWLSSVKMSVVDDAQTDPKEAMREAKRWATSAGIALYSAAYNEGWGVFHAIMGDIQASKADPVKIDQEGEVAEPPGE